MAVLFHPANCILLSITCRFSRPAFKARRKCTSPFADASARVHSVACLIPPLYLVQHSEHVRLSFLKESKQCQDRRSEEDDAYPPDPGLLAVDGGVPDHRENVERQETDTQEEK